MSDMLSALVHATVLLPVFVLGWPPPVFYKLPECTSHRTGNVCPIGLILTLIDTNDLCAAV